jgi:hypothetical protein
LTLAQEEDTQEKPYRSRKRHKSATLRSLGPQILPKAEEFRHEINATQKLKKSTKRS